MSPKTQETWGCIGLAVCILAVISIYTAIAYEAGKTSVEGEYQRVAEEVLCREACRQGEPVYTPKAPDGTPSTCRCLVAPEAEAIP